MRVSLPLTTVSTLNRREHWAARHRRAKGERRAAFMLTLGAPKPPCTVSLTRVAPAHRHLDDDNLRGALKAVRDGIADRLGIDDADPRVRWRYRQKVGANGVDVKITPTRSTKP